MGQEGQLDAPVFAWYFPAEHITQVAAAVAPSVVENEPAGHAVQLEAEVRPVPAL